MPTTKVLRCFFHPVPCPIPFYTKGKLKNALRFSSSAQLFVHTALIFPHTAMPHRTQTPQHKEIELLKLNFIVTFVM